MAPRILILSIVLGAEYSSYVKSIATYAPSLELVSKELNHLAAILHVYAGSLIFMK